MLVETTDLSPISAIGNAEDRWLRLVAHRSITSALTLHLSPHTDENEEPLLSFNARTGIWWTGRYIGELKFEDGILRILPRFGIPCLYRWISRIWGIRIISSLGRYEPSGFWLLELLAKLWEARLLAATKHGLPTRRIDEVHVGQTVRGRLDVKSSARRLRTGNYELVSRSRNRSIDRQIASVVLCAFANLQTQLAHLGDPRVWLTPRGQTLIGGLQNQYRETATRSSPKCKDTIRYTPITEAYRPLVALSLSILRQRPMSSATQGRDEVLGVLIDMAEVWELYVYNLLRSAITGAEVLHTGRARDAEDYLLRSVKTGIAPLGRLKPDVVIRSFSSSQPLSVLDAKYKSTVPSAEKPFGVVREDLYQLNAYLSAFGGRDAPVIGGLVYPAEPSSAVIHLQEANAWYTTRAGAPFYFFGIDGSPPTEVAQPLTPGEAAFVASIQTLMRQAT